MRVAAMGLLFVVLVWGQSSTPVYWRYAPAEPAMLIGVDWRQASQSNLAGLIGGAAASLDFAEEITNLLVAVEPGAGNGRFLATASGRFNLAKLRRMAATDGAKAARYRGVEVFSAGGTEVAVLDGWVLLVGDTASVRAALDRGNAATPRESPLWRRAAELSTTYAIWIASSSLEAYPSSPLAGAARSGGGPRGRGRKVHGLARHRANGNRTESHAGGRGFTARQLDGLGGFGRAPHSDRRSGRAATAKESDPHRGPGRGHARVPVPGAPTLVPQPFPQLA